MDRTNGNITYVTYSAVLQCYSFSRSPRVLFIKKCYTTLCFFPFTFDPNPHLDYYLHLTHLPPHLEVVLETT